MLILEICRSLYNLETSAEGNTSTCCAIYPVAWLNRLPGSTLGRWSKVHHQFTWAAQLIELGLILISERNRIEMLEQRRPTAGQAARVYFLILSSIESCGLYCR